MKDKIHNKVVEAAGLGITFGEKVVLHDFNLTVNEGENVVVLGKSGSGKSVFIKCISGLLNPSFGTMKVFGKDIYSLSENELNQIRLQLGLVFQSSALYDSMTVKENISFAMEMNKSLNEKEIAERVTEVLTNVNLLHTLNNLPAELSGGMRKRIGVARALAMHPRLLLYDEPTAGLDPITSKEISHLIMDVRQKYSASSVIITHDINCAKITADRIVILHEGKAYWEGSFENLLKSVDPIVKGFID